ncbi:MAG: ABC-F family ATP-binding cassette domain-containing protein [Clostridia bacterium]|nr:ABC-F family ATP-binding cassette domain-containing protein [Clostridia bacterium]
MITVNNVRLQFGGRVLFDEVNLKFSKGNCYGIIGANGAGKSTFLKVLSGQIEPSSGEVVIDQGERMSVLVQNQNAYDNLSVLETVIGGYERLVEVMHEREQLYAKPDFSDEDGVRAGELENEFLEMGGWEAEGEAQTLLQDLGIAQEYFGVKMADMEPKQKVKVMLARALFKSPDILILDEPTNNLDAKTVNWLENYLLDYPNTVIVVSHNRYFLNKICTHICDVDFQKINMYVGNYDFWYETSQLLARQAKEQNKKAEQRAKELKEFIARFAANASKSKQATSRKKELEKLEFVEIKPSSRKYPYIDFRPEREVGNEVLQVINLSKLGYFENVSFTVQKGDKIAFLSDRANDTTMLYKILVGEEQPDSGFIKWGSTTKISYLPENNDKYFDGCDLNLVQWLGQYSKDQDQTFLRGWLGRMLFTGEESQKQAKVLSGGEKVRCMMARAMLTAGNVLILDEPTNHLDLESITALNKGMINYKSPMLFTSQDHEILQTVANRIIVINGKKTFDKQCTYNDYLGID